MTNEMKISNLHIQEVNAQLVAMATGHMAALALISQVRGDDQLDANSLYYRMFQPLEEGQSVEGDLERLAEYVCSRHENVSGEQLFRKAAELALHGAPAAAFFDQSFEVQMAYRLFAKTCRLAFIDLQIEQREIQTRHVQEHKQRKPIPLEDQTFAPQEKPMAKDPVYAKATKAIKQMPKAKADLSKKVADKGADNSADQVMSIGEAPVKHQGKPQRGGARQQKN